MSEMSQQWRAEGIENARNAGGIDLELYRRPGFTGGPSVRRVSWPSGGSGLGPIRAEVDPMPDWDPPMKARKR